MESILKNIQRLRGLGGLAGGGSRGVF